MRIIAVLFTIGVLSGAMAIRAQVEQPALQGLLAYGVTLTGTPENPVLENHSGRVVIGYDVKVSDANGRGMTQNQVMATSGLPAGIPDGGSVYVRGAAPVKPTVPMPSSVQVRVTGQGPIITVVLRSVIFADGQFVGADEQGTCSVGPWWSGDKESNLVMQSGIIHALPFRECLFEEFGKKLKAITEVGMMARIQAWDQIEGLAQALARNRQAPPPSVPPLSAEDRILTNFRQIAALQLVQTRKSKGETAADQFAEVYRSLPTLWK